MNAQDLLTNKMEQNQRSSGVVCRIGGLVGFSPQQTPYNPRG
ncbi:hypothetical protein HHE02_11240 [Helicobacter heilmannii]|uniref:Uncharacterized protein n=1 Tax=Helicobacter heilmannii TaxID=35817 RepID=A0A0K2XMQ5_HELHE|nr:hypothetical protein BN341_3890 [Helicobacter heilmannii ASB1.4]CRF47828.1 hypothetical protein HHE02_11240 [Helicobacter heilmannii]CRF49001.1 hypothetical protein HHE03_05970 [Helicobacter heilmannii]CRF51516.1 hypothetical protein HHE06_14000 [Helicobacter heilmannii]CRI34133.1 hypothetical protein HHE01_09790 [Helicobacter heilmannii]